MASGSVISLGVQVDGESTFKSALSAIDAEIKNLGAGVSAATEAMGKMGGDAEAAAKKTELLGKTVDAQKEKLSILSQQYESANKRLEELAKALEEAKKSGDTAAIEKATNAYNKQSAQVSKLSTEMNKTEKEISKATNAMEKGEDAATDEGKAMDNTGKASEDLASKVDKMASMMELQFAGKAVGAVVDGMKAIADKAIEAGKEIYNLTTEAGQYADSLLTLAETTNTDVVNLQRWEYASKFIDTEVSTITGSMKKLSTNMYNMSDATAEAFDQLGVSVTDSTGELRSSEDVFWEVVDALGDIENATERDNVAMALMGKSATDLNPLINAGSEAFKALGDEAEAAGLILSEDTVGSLGAVDDAVNRMQAGIDAASRNIAAAFAPAVTELVDGASSVIEAFIGMVQGTEGSAEQFEAAIGNMVDTALKVLTDMLPVVLDTGIKVIFSLVEGILSKIDEISATITKVVTQLLTTLVQHLPEIIEGGIKIIIALVKGIIDSLPEIVKCAPEIIVAIVKGLADLGWQLIEAGANIIKGIAQGILSMVGWLWEQIKNALGSVFGWLLDLLGIHSPSTLMRDRVGKMLAMGVAQGIADGAGEVQQAFDDMLPDAAHITASVDSLTVAARVAGGSAGSAETAAAVFRDDRPIVIQLNDREVGRAVRGYV